MMIKAMLLAVVLTLAIFQFNCNVEAATNKESPHPKRKPGGCYRDGIGHLKAGEKIPVPKKCEQAYCLEDKSGSMQIISCDPVDKSWTCADKEKTYPQCCPRKCTTKDRLVGCALRLMRAPNCYKDIPVDLRKPYPHCCPVKCIKDHL
ncbi:uncharacterized protein LOC123010362 [Tribolium madens]|uniref:uncharacterized protein LOC123010362 n=1 Tax=Tribolium madens TaxID=41895 RepID=UPI001CF75161|nr:uncharacterized protein LOC123010362 [Tribolium madens]